MTKRYTTLFVCQKNIDASKDTSLKKDVDSKVPPAEKIIKTLIYDIWSSGKQAQCALRKVAEIFKDKYPDVHQIILNLAYMDDFMVARRDKEETNKRKNDLQMVFTSARVFLFIYFLFFVKKTISTNVRK